MRNKLNLIELKPSEDYFYTRFYRRIKNNKITKYYRLHLRRHSFIRKMASLFVKNLLTLNFYIYRYFIYRDKFQKHDIIALKEYLSMFRVGAVDIFDPEKINTPRPFFTSDTHEKFFISPGSDYTFPSVYLAKLTEVDVTGRSNIIFKDKFAICHDLYDVNRDLTSEEMHGRYKINERKQQLTRSVPGAPDAILEEAAIFCDACAPNWAHWITEILPRIVAFCKLEDYRDVPILIDANLHPNMIETLLAFIDNHRKVYALPSGGRLRVSIAYIISVCGYVPFDRKVTIANAPFQGMFSPAALSLLSNNAATDNDQSYKNGTPKKIFLQRNSSYRKLENSAEIESALKVYGYEVVDPEKLSFLQQVRLFSEAESIVGPTGAAFANIVFCKPDTNIVVLISLSELAPYWYWQNIACATGNKVKYVLSEGDALHDVHDNFKVNINDILATIGEG